MQELKRTVTAQALPNSTNGLTEDMILYPPERDKRKCQSAPSCNSRPKMEFAQRTRFSQTVKVRGPVS